VRIEKADGSKLCSGTESAQSAILLSSFILASKIMPVAIIETKLRKDSFEISILAHDKKESTVTLNLP
jgi:hypothetical protein